MQEAAAMFEESLGIRRQIYGTGHRLTLTTQILLGQTSLALEEVDAAREMLQNALKEAQIVFDDDHELLISTKKILAEINR